MPKKKEVRFLMLNPWSLDDLYFYYEGDAKEDADIHRWIQENEHSVMTLSEKRVISVWDAFRFLYFGESFDGKEYPTGDVECRAASGRQGVEEEAFDRLLTESLRELRNRFEVSEEPR